MHVFCLCQQSQEVQDCEHAIVSKNLKLRINCFVPIGAV